MDSIFEGLPPTALIAAGVTVGLVFVVRYFGMAAGEKSLPSSSQGAATVAAVIVDPTALNLLSSKASDLAAAISRLVSVGEDMHKSQTHVATELDRIREELRIQREIARGRG